MTPTEHLLAFAAARHVLPEAVRADTLRLLADTLAVGAAGSTAPGMDGVLAVARSWGKGSDARLIARDERLPAMGAAYVNCFAIHALEWDAVHEGAVVHAMSAVVPAVMAAADRKGGADPEAVLAAIAVGVDVAAGLGVAAETALTFFRPATAGIYGAALAVARIAGLPEGRFADVLGMAHAHAAGTMQAHSEGSIALPLQFANAARGAIHAADLVRHGLTAAHDVIEGPFGHLRLFDRGSLETYTRTLGQRWLISQVSTKPYPSGRASHAVLGTLQPFAGQEVARVEAHVPPLIRHLVGRPHDPAMTPAYARLCLPFLAALMLRDGEIDPRRFAPETFADPQIAALAARFALHDDGNADPNALSPQRLVIVLADGSRVECAVPATLGAPDAPLSAAQAEAKRVLCRRLAFADPDPRLLADPLSFITDPA
ncbi:MAG: MmgE/PrpD family protein [Novosphingobium meiothermophilum]|uniref:MmgE/PrpD family protein n=1 Tax=Novosphingobium meiothermophilum TaxID=2202251 RepID=UPI000D6E8F69|nr:MmgE/PrpD family protein [Novosphingobium meiothermophilum]